MIRQKDNAPQLDDIVITFARVTPVQFLALQKRLEATPGVLQVKDPDATPP